MTLTERKEAFIYLGNFLSQFTKNELIKDENIPHNDLFFEKINRQIQSAQEHNPWFTIENIKFALKQWSQALSEQNLNRWVSSYSFEKVTPKKVAIVMAGNIPLVGFHDFLSVLITGHRVLIKQSSKDKQLLPYLAKYLEAVNPKFKNYIEFTDQKLQNFDAIIATGSNNTARYFEYYFKEKPHIIRKNRNSVSVITGNESMEQLKCLSEDIFSYFGLGCRNVSKIYVPQDYNFDKLFQAIYPWHDLINKQKYANNYDYNKAVYLMSEFDFLDNGFFILKEDTKLSSPIATCFYEYYTTIEELKQTIKNQTHAIQCIVSGGLFENETPFGQTQQPQLWEYADQIDTVDFLLKI